MARAARSSATAPDLTAQTMAERQPMWSRMERRLDRWFPPGTNPLLHLGSLACLMLGLLLLSGIYLFIVFDTSATGAYQSIESLAREQPYAGGWLRSVHRYAADAMWLFTLAHLLREWALGRYRHFRRATWWTGIPLLVFLYLSGIGGFWLNWDQLGQYSALASAELIDALPFIGAGLSRQFIGTDAVSDRLFSLLIFVHIGVALMLLFGLWFHLQRLGWPAVLPPRRLTGGALCVLGLLALLQPVLSQAPADLTRAPTTLAFDWILLHLLPLAEVNSPGWVWLLLLTALVALAWLPWRGGHAAPVAAVVDADHCNGCRRCVVDCPFGAITLAAHPNGKPGQQLAVVDADRCASCGICAGACPTSTPFRRDQQLVSGIDMPQLPVDGLRRQVRAGLDALQGERKVLLFGCDQGADIAALRNPDAAGISLLCAGQLPPSFIEFALRAGATEVVVATCAEGACAYRLGNRWTVERLAGAREPHLRASVPAGQYRVVHASRGDEAQLTWVIDAANARSE